MSALQSWFSDPNLGRKFIDDILDVSQKWTNLNPGIEIKVGDFGKIDGATGQFMCRGNLYENSITSKLMENYKPPPPSAETLQEIFASRTVKSVEVNAGGTMDNPKVGGKWEFRNDRGALLIMVKPRLRYLRTLPSELADKDVLKGMHIVMEVYSCPIYYLYQGNTSSRTLEVEFCAAPSEGAALDIQSAWKVNYSGFVDKRGYEPAGEHVFFPMFGLQAFQPDGDLKPTTRGDDREPDSLLVRIEWPPWGALDVDGNEIPFKDNIRDEDPK